MLLGSARRLSGDSNGAASFAQYAISEAGDNSPHPKSSACVSYSGGRSSTTTINRARPDAPQRVDHLAVGADWNDRGMPPMTSKAALRTELAHAVRLFLAAVDAVIEV